MIARALLAWLGMMLLAMLNALARDALYAPMMSELAAHQLSTLILILVFAAYFWSLSKVWRIGSAKQAWQIGVIWLILTVAFEFSLGRLAAGKPWSELLANYNVLAGRVWVFIPLWTLIGPTLIFRLHRENS